MTFVRKTRWDVQVCFKGWTALGTKSRTDVEQSPETAIKALDEFLASVKDLRRRYRKRLRDIARDPALRAKAVKAGILSPGPIEIKRKGGE